MPGKKRRKYSIIAIIIFGIAGLLLAFIIYFNIITRIKPPEVADRSVVGLKVGNPAEDFYTCKKNWLKKSNSGLWELYLEGKPLERGVINGKLTKNLIRMQEEAFVSQINQIVPSKNYQ